LSPHSTGKSVLENLIDKLQTTPMGLESMTSPSALLLQGVSFELELIGRKSKLVFDSSFIPL